VTPSDFLNILIFLILDYAKMGFMKNPEYLSVWKEREKEEKRRRDLAIKKAKSVAKTLKERYQAEEIILFGSLIWRTDFLWTGTDIDLIVKGLEDERYFEILADISRISHPFHVDLIPFEKAWPSMKKRALKEGLRLA
jgi:predicted nucleotidyltransferase